MTMKALWAIVVMISIALMCVTYLLSRHVDPTAIVSVISVLAVPVVGAALYNKMDSTSSKVDTVQQQTNGSNKELMSLVASVVDHLKTHASVPVSPQGTVTTTVVEPPKQEASKPDAGQPS